MSFDHALSAHLRNVEQPNKPQVIAAETGTVVWFDGRFGFIEPDLGGRDIYVAQKDLRGVAALEKGQRVAYYLGQGRDDRPKAVNVSVVAQ